MFPCPAIKTQLNPVLLLLLPRLIKYLDSMKPTDKVIIFCATKRGCEKLYRSLQKETFSVLPIHGDKSQIERDQALEVLRSGQINILVATDVASR